jgi:hypothetical protein
LKDAIAPLQVIAEQSGVQEYSPMTSHGYDDDLGIADDGS